MPSLQSTIFRLFARARSARSTAGSIEADRAKMVHNFRRLPLPRGTMTQDISANGVETEWLSVSTTEPHRIILYFHGGGFVFGTHQTHRPLLARLCESAYAHGLSINYRRAPEYPFPAAVDDCVSAYRWLLSEGIMPQTIVLAGDSAGGNLTLTTLLALRDNGDPLPAAAVCLSPVTDLAEFRPSYQTNLHRDVSLRPSWRDHAKLYIQEHDPYLPLISPLYGDLHGLPPLLIQVGSDELLLDDAVLFAERARAAGVMVNLETWQQMWHVWHFYSPMLPEARGAIHHIGAFIRQHTLQPDRVGLA